MKKENLGSGADGIAFEMERQDMITTDIDDRVAALAVEEWAWRKSVLGSTINWIESEVDDFLPNITPEAQAQREAHWTELMAELDSIDSARLSNIRRVDLAVLKFQTRAYLIEQKHRLWEAPANSDSAPWNDLIENARRPLENSNEVEAYLRQLRDVPSYLGSQIENMRAGIERGFGPTGITMQGRDATVWAVVEAGDDNPFSAAIRSAQERGAAHYVETSRLQAGLDWIHTEVLPAFAELGRFLTEEYFPGLPDEVSASERYGDEFYRDQIFYHASVNTAPESIHEQGLAMVSSIGSEMEACAHRLGFDGDVPRLLEHMRTSSEFYATTAKQLLAEAAWECKEFDGKVHQYFGVVPKTRFTIEEPDPNVAPYYTFGRGGLGKYVLNTYKLENRPMYSLPALTLHEGAPGHAFQVPLALENDDLLEFRQKSYISGFGEGWGLYSERLGVEMGMYHNDFEIMGMLSFQMWRAVRLVVDTGVHALGWSRQAAIEYLREHTAIGFHEVVTEVDRYIAWPGQAVSYAVGLTVIQDLRQQLEATEGHEFDIRAFHDAVLGLGCVPLPVLSAEVPRVYADIVGEKS